MNSVPYDNYSDEKVENIINATKSFANSLGPKGIIVNTVAPGPVETEMMALFQDNSIVL